MAAMLNHANEMIGDGVHPELFVQGHRPIATSLSFQDLLVVGKGLVPGASPDLLGEALVVGLEVRVGGAGSCSVESPEGRVRPASPGFLLEDDLGGAFDTAVTDALLLEFSAQQA